MKILGVIPARYASTRLPGKPLALIGEKPMVLRVYEQCLKAEGLNGVIIATDDERIFQTAQSAGARVVMTRSTHPTGTDRVIEVAEQLPQYDAYINIQGDEPFIEPEQVNQVAALLRSHEGTFVATLVKLLTDPGMLHDPNAIKVVKAPDGRALYFSRSAIPFMRNEADPQQWTELHPYWQHVGIYGYSAGALHHIRTLSPSLLEKAESLEQLRWMEAGIPIFTAITEGDSLSVDSPQDLERARLHLRNFLGL